MSVSELRGLGKLIAEGPKCFVGDTLVTMAEPFEVLTAADDGFLTWALSDRRVVAGVSFVMLGAAGVVIFRKRKRQSSLALDMAIEEWNARIEEDWLQSARPRRIADDDLLPADELFAQCDDLAETDHEFEGRFSHLAR